MPSDVVWPKFVVVEAGDPLAKLIHESKSLDLPFIDLDVVVEHVVDCLLEYTTADMELLHLPLELMKGEILTSRAEFPQDTHQMWFEDMSESPMGLEYIANLARKLGVELKTLFKAYKLFEEDILKYEYSGIMNERTVILRFRHGGRHAR